MTTSPRIGDCLLVAGPEPADREPVAFSRSGRDTTWQREDSLERGTRSRDAALWVQPAVEGWAGYELRQVAGRRWSVVVLTEWIDNHSWQQFEEEIRTHEGDDPPIPRNGQFLVVARDTGVTGDVVIASDPFGTLHAYVAEQGGRQVAGTALAAVARTAGIRAVDPIALHGFCTTGFFPGDRTAWSGVRIIRPGTLCRLRAGGGVEMSEWWQWPEGDAPPSRGDAIHQLDAELREVLAEQIDGVREDCVALPISGGLDSRTTVAALTDSSSRQSFFAFGYDLAGQRRETTIGRRVAELRGLDFHAMTVGAYLLDSLDSGTESPGRLLEGVQDLTQPRQFAVRDALRHCEVLVAAHWGDVWFDRIAVPAAIADDDDAGLAAWLCDRMRKPGHQWLNDHLLIDGVRSSDASDALAAIWQQEAASVPAGPADQRAKRIKTRTWSFRWTLASLRTYRAAVQVRAPFYDTRLVQLLTAIPESWHSGRRLQIALLRQTAPDLARVEWQAAGANLFEHPLPRWRSLPRRARRRAARMFTRYPLVQRNWEVQFLGHGLPGYHRARLLARLRDRLVAPGPLHSWLEPRAIERLLDQLANRPDREVGYAVSMLVTLDDWLRSVE